MKTFAMLALSMLGVLVLSESEHNCRQINKLTVSHFSWENCGKAEAVVLKELSVSPDPINIPGKVTVSASGTTSVELQDPLNVKIILKKRVLWWFWKEIACVSNVGSCHYRNICDIFNQISPPGKDCPETLHKYGLPCRCPFKSGFYKLPQTDFLVPVLNVPSVLINGEYHIEAHLGDGVKQLGCLKATLTLHSE